MQRISTMVIGAGQCGISMSRELTRRSIDHIVLDAGQAGESWRSRRWDSLRLLTPNWMSVLAGDQYDGADPDSFMTAADFAGYLEQAVDKDALPVQEQTSVHSVGRLGDGYIVQTNQGVIAATNVVIATGACIRPRVPGFASLVPKGTEQLSPIQYRTPADLGAGRVLVVGASASGLQLARELALSGRSVTLSVGNHSRLPRSYRGADILAWMHLIHAFDEPFTKVDDLERVRRTPSLPLIGTPNSETVDINQLQALGVEVVGRAQDVRDGKVLFSGGLDNLCQSADLKMNRLLDRIDAWVAERGFEDFVDPAQRYSPTDLPASPRLSMELEGVDTIVWATGFFPDHSFVDLPVFDRKGRIKHVGGCVEPGLYVMGLPHLRTARSVHIDGAARDAKALARQIQNQLAMPLAA
ncbi:MAG: NAD(P)-binding domain-containing protein [Pseudomonadota bacterium]